MSASSPAGPGRRRSSRGEAAAPAATGTKGRGGKAKPGARRKASRARRGTKPQGHQQQGPERRPSREGIQMEVSHSADTLRMGGGADASRRGGAAPLGTRYGAAGHTQSVGAVPRGGRRISQSLARLRDSLVARSATVFVFGALSGGGATPGIARTAEDGASGVGGADGDKDATGRGRVRMVTPIIAPGKPYDFCLVVDTDASDDYEADWDGPTDAGGLDTPAGVPRGLSRRFDAAREEVGFTREESEEHLLAHLHGRGSMDTNEGSRAGSMSDEGGRKGSRRRRSGSGSGSGSGADLDHAIGRSGASSMQPVFTHAGMDPSRPPNTAALELVVDALSRVGLHVDVVHTRYKGVLTRGTSAPKRAINVAVLLVRAPSKLCVKYRVLNWLKYGNVRDMRPFGGATAANPERWERAYVRHFGAVSASPGFEDADTMQALGGGMTSAERVEIVDRVIRKDARVDQSLPWVLNAFPLHDGSVSDANARKYVTWRHMVGWMTPWKAKTKFLSAMNATFGQRVAYYFAFSDLYSKMLFPLSVAGLLMHGVWMFFPDIYMRVLPFWGLLCSTVWPFVLLKYWDRRESALQFAWGDLIEAEGIPYPNPLYKGPTRRNVATGEHEPMNQRYKRWPKQLVVALFVFTLAAVMLVVNAALVTLYDTQHAVSPLIMGVCIGLVLNFPFAMLVRTLGNVFTRWMNYPTEAMVLTSKHSLSFTFDLFLYVSWFLILAVLYVTPDMGDYVTNALNYFFFADPISCCFGDYVSTSDPNQCAKCPPPMFTPNSKRPTECVPCRGFFSFSSRVDITTTFIVPVAIVQVVNLALAVLEPLCRRVSIRIRQRTRSTSAVTPTLNPVGGGGYTDAKTDTSEGGLSMAHLVSRGDDSDTDDEGRGGGGGGDGDGDGGAPRLGTAPRGSDDEGGAMPTMREESGDEDADDADYNEAPMSPSRRSGGTIARSLESPRMAAGAGGSYTSLPALDRGGKHLSANSLASLGDRPDSRASAGSLHAGNVSVRSMESPLVNTTGFVQGAAGPVDNFTGQPVVADDVLGEGVLPDYDEAAGYRSLVRQFAFVSMFSSLFPLWPGLSWAVHVLHARADAYAVCYTSRRPQPRKVNGIGEWKRNVRVVAYLSVVINIAVVCFSTSALDHWFDACDTPVKTTAATFFLPNFTCVSIQMRLGLALAGEHAVLACVVWLVRRVASVPGEVRIAVERKELAFKKMLDELVGEGSEYGAGGRGGGGDAHGDAEVGGEFGLYDGGGHGAKQRVGRRGGVLG